MLKICIFHIKNRISVHQVHDLSIVLLQKIHQISKYSGICEYYFIWKKGVFVDVVKFRILKLAHPELSRWSLYLMTSVFIRRREDKDTENKAMWRWGWRLHTSQKCQGPQEDGSGQDRCSHRAFGGSMGLLTPQF